MAKTTTLLATVMVVFVLLGHSIGSPIVRILSLGEGSRLLCNNTVRAVLWRFTNINTNGTEFLEPSSPTGTLNVESFNRSISGRYDCIARGNSSIVLASYLLVAAADLFEPFSQSQHTVIEGQSVTIDVSIRTYLLDHSPLHDIGLNRNRVQIQRLRVSDGMASYTIPAASLGDSGNYSFVIFAGNNHESDILVIKVVPVVISPSTTQLVSTSVDVVSTEKYSSPGSRPIGSSGHHNSGEISTTWSTSSEEIPTAQTTSSGDFPTAQTTSSGEIPTTQTISSGDAPSSQTTYSGAISTSPQPRPSGNFPTSSHSSNARPFSTPSVLLNLQVCLDYINRGYLEIPQPSQSCPGSNTLANDNMKSATETMNASIPPSTTATPHNNCESYTVATWSLVVVIVCGLPACLCLGCRIQKWKDSSGPCKIKRPFLRVGSLEDGTNSPASLRRYRRHHTDAISNSQTSLQNEQTNSTPPTAPQSESQSMYQNPSFTGSLPSVFSSEVCPSPRVATNVKGTIEIVRPRIDGLS